VFPEPVVEIYGLIVFILFKYFEICHTFLRSFSVVSIFLDSFVEK